MKERLIDVDENILQNMSSDSLKHISHLLQCYQQFIVRSMFSLKKQRRPDLLSLLRSSITFDESQFLVGTGYLKLAKLVQTK